MTIMTESELSTPLQRASELLSRMTLAEKTRQVTGIMPTALAGPNGIDPAAVQTHLGLGIGHISNVGMMAQSPVDIANAVNGIQGFLVNNTRLGIPALVHAEALNGFVAPAYTSFPTAIALAATWHPEAIKEMATVIRGQMRTVGVPVALSPVMDIARDSRWGRVHETYGEDVLLVSAFSVAFTQGLQGEDLREGVIATGKHFLGYAMTEAGQNMAATQFGSRELYDVYATPFEAAIRLGGLANVMNSYAEIDGLPAGASREVLTDLLRGRMGFDGTVVSDYNTVEMLHSRQRVAATLGEAGAIALHAGLDVELPNPIGYGATLEAEIVAGRADEAELDDAVLRVLVDKFRLGLFENPYASSDPIEITATIPAGQDLSRSLARESVTLLKNDGTLPLAAPTRIAVIGPNAQDAVANFAAYTFPASIDMLKAMVTGDSRMAGVEAIMNPSGGDDDGGGMGAMVGALMAVDTEQVVRGAYGALSLVDAVKAAFPDAEVTSAQGVGIRPDAPQDIEGAVAAAQGADVVILALGGRSGWFSTLVTEGEGTDTAQVELPREQVDLTRALAATGKPLVGVYYMGHALAVTEVENLLSASVLAYYPGPYGAAAVAAVLCGELNPSGRLPYTLPRATGQLPIYHSHKNGSGYRRTAADMFTEYGDISHLPLYPFGHGLSFSTFEYGTLVVEMEHVPADGGVISASIEVRNTSGRAGIEVVQVYASYTTRGVTRPGQQLVGFVRVELEAGEAATVRAQIPVSLLGFTGEHGRFILQPGTVVLSAGASSDDLRSEATLTITGAVADLEGRRDYLPAVSVTRP